MELLWLGIKEKELKELDTNTIGTERAAAKEVKMIEEIGITSVDNIITWTLNKSPMKAALVYKYFRGMQLAIKEMYRVVKDGSYVILVVGNNKVLGKIVDTHRLLTDLALIERFKEILILKDSIRKKGMITRRHNSGGLINEEFTIVLKKEGV